MDTNKIEQTLLDRELKNISESLGKIGLDIRNVFEKYGKIEGQHSDELHNYIISHVLRVGSNYFAGYSTVPQTNNHPDHIPDCFKKIVLEWAVKDFFENLDNMIEVVGDMQ